MTVRQQAALLLPLLGALLAGCGGSSITRPNPSPATEAGALRFSLAWPALPPEGGRLIPQRASTIEIDVKEDAPGTYHSSVKIERPATSREISRVPTGWVTINARAYAAESSTPLATGSVRVEVKPHVATPVPLTLESTITRVTLAPDQVELQEGGTVMLVPTARNAQGQIVLNAGFSWQLTGDVAAVTPFGEPSPLTYSLRGVAKGTVTVTATEVESKKQGTATVTVGESENEPPVIRGWTVTPDPVPPGSTAQISIEAHDPDGDALTYTWSAAAGTLSGSGATVTWTAPNTEGTYSVTVSVKDAKHPAVTQSCAVVVSSGARYQVQEVEGFNPRGMNNHGQIAGSSGDHPAAVWDNGVVTPLPQPADRQYQAMDINDQGVVVGLGLWRSYSGNAVYRACRWRNDQFSLLDGDWHRDTLQINNIGRYAGVLYPFTHEEGPNVGLPWGMRAGQDGVTLLAPPCPIYYLDQENDQFYNSGQNYDASMTYANAINDTGHVAGYSHIARYSGLGTLDVYHATLWENGTPIDLDAGRDGTSHAYGLNNVNRVVGLYVEGFDFQSRAQACQWFAGQRTPLPDLPGTNTSEARAINNANQIVGQCRVGTDWRAVLWENGTAIDLNTVCDPLPNGRVLLEPLEINDAGQILCRALGPEETANKWYLLTPRQSRQRMPRRTAGGMEDEDPLRSARAAAGALPAPDRMRQLVSHPAKPLPRY